MFGRAMAGLDALAVWTSTAELEARLIRGKPADTSTATWLFLAGGDLAGTASGVAGIASGFEYSQAARALIAKRVSPALAFTVAKTAAGVLGTIASFTNLVEAYGKNDEHGMLAAGLGLASGVSYLSYLASFLTTVTGPLAIILAVFSVGVLLFRDTPLDEWFEDCYWNESEGAYDREEIFNVQDFIAAIAEGNWPERDRYEVPADRLSDEIDELVKLIARPSIDLSLWTDAGEDGGMERSVFYVGGPAGRRQRHELPTTLRIAISPGLMPPGTELELSKLQIYSDEFDLNLLGLDDTIFELASPIRLRRDPRVETVLWQGAATYYLPLDLDEMLGEEAREELTEDHIGEMKFEGELAVVSTGQEVPEVSADLSQRYVVRGGLTYRVRTFPGEEPKLADPRVQIEALNE